MVAKEGLVWDSTNLAFHAEAALRLGTTFSINSCVLVQAAITEYRTLGGLSKRALFLIALEAGSLRSRFQLIWFQGEGSLPSL